MSYVVEIPDTRFHLRIDEMIWAEDPHVREVQAQYWKGIDDEVGRQVKMAGIVHPTGDNVAEFSLLYMKKLIRDVRKKYGLREAAVEPVDQGFADELERRFQTHLSERQKLKRLMPHVVRDDSRNPAQRSIVYK